MGPRLFCHSARVVLHASHNELVFAHLRLSSEGNNAPCRSGFTLPASIVSLIANTKPALKLPAVCGTCTVITCPEFVTEVSANLLEK